MGRVILVALIFPGTFLVLILAFWVREKWLQKRVERRYRAYRRQK
jgi:protein-S-isoprenylcysteine O-methyltransferase Ste14